jgi:hypothetical protein
MGGGFIMYSRMDYCRRQAIVAKQHAARAADLSAKAAFEEVANHWIALAEQVEWLEGNNDHGVGGILSKRKDSAYAPADLPTRR